MHPIDLLKLCGIDMESPQVIQEALDVFGKLLEEWDQLKEKDCRVKGVIFSQDSHGGLFF